MARISVDPDQLAKSLKYAADMRAAAALIAAYLAKIDPQFDRKRFEGIAGGWVPA